MQFTDACVFPYPAGDSSLRRMALDARHLGLDSLVAAGAEAGIVHGVSIIPGIMLEGAGIREIRASARQLAGRPALFSARAGDYAFNRALIGIPGIRVLRGLQDAPKNAFDHIIARQAAERGIAVDLDVGFLVRCRGPARQRAIQRYADLGRLQGKYEFLFTLSTGAHSVLDMKSRRDIRALCGLFGMAADLVDETFGTPGRILRPDGPVEVVP